MTESELESAVRRILASLGPRVLAYHTHNSRRSCAGFPDWVFTGPGGCIFRELKRESGRLTGAQQEWLETLVLAGVNVAVWRPADLLSGRVAAELAAVAGMVPAW